MRSTDAPVQGLHACNKARIVHVALLVIDNGEEGIEEAIYRALRPAVNRALEKPYTDGIIDYAFNSNGNAPKLPEPRTYELPADLADYEEDAFYDAMPVPSKLDCLLSADLATHPNYERGMTRLLEPINDPSLVLGDPASYAAAEMEMDAEPYDGLS